VGSDLIMREQRLVFGEVADEYADVRAGYADELVSAVFGYLGRVPEQVVEVGAGTGKATAAFVARGVPLTCVEPDPAMAAVLRRRFPQVGVAVSGFEEWIPPAGGVPLLICAQAWHWVDEARRLDLAYAALVPGGVLALFGHVYGFADAPVEERINEVYARHARELLKEDPPQAENWLTDELAGSPLFTDVTGRWFRRVEPYPALRYVRLLNTFSPHRMLAEDRRERLLTGIAEVIEAAGGVLRVQLDTFLTLGRRVSRGTVGPS
jgi:SAM-dependent methyltransferase